ncbi:MAG: FHA domain-containing protein, partial [Acetobacteraceae bacterium]|nr:FHA domain-containing protein [Acetobacteraceae bacterium]
EVAVGRSAGNNIVIADAFTSQYHARIRNEGGRLLLEDLGSTNGTYLNGKRIKTRAALKDGDKISIGGVTFQLVRCGHEMGTSN